ncbi:MAG TPA: hypothetical protein VGG28_30940 [Kofleriaceae bacterium]|jgi:hypothetical protein
MKRLLVLLVACGGTSAPAPETCADAGPACGSACIATFAGNFASSSASADNCAQVAGSMLAFAVASNQLDAPLMIAIDLGHAGPGAFSSETAQDWSALASRSTPAGECVYSAGAQSVPTGSFAMTIASVDAASAHGELRVVQYVQAQPTVDCGSGDTETVDVQF